MLITISVLALAAIGFFLFHSAAKKSLDRQLSGAVTAVQAATYMRLMRRYQAVHSKDVAVDLSVAITNELFGQEPTAEMAISFRKENHGLISRSLSELKDDNDLRVAVTDANRVLATLQYRDFSGERRVREIRRITAHLEKLIVIGILLPDRPAPQKLRLFMAMAHKFYEQNAVEGDP